MKRKKRGLTIVEVLVVVLVLIIMFALLMPGICITKVSGHKIMCANNTRQIGIALKQHATDNAGDYPWLSGHAGVSTPDLRAAELGLLFEFGDGYLPDGTVFSCFAAVKQRGRIIVTNALDADAETSYSYFDSRIPEMFDGGKVAAGKFRGAANLVIVADEPAEDKTGRSLDQGKWNHSDGQSLLFLDAHVRFSPSTNPDGDADSGSIYAVSGDPKTDTRIE